MNRNRRRIVRPQRRCGRRRGIVVLLALLASTVQLTEPARAAGTCRELSARMDADDLTVLQVTLDRDRLILSPALMAYETEQGVFLPLGDLVRAFEFPIAVHPGEARAEGWFLNERRRFELELAARCHVSVMGKSRSFDPARVSLQPDDIYVHSTLIEQWLPVALEYDPSRLLLSVAAEEPLPVLQRLEREARWSRLGRSPPVDAVDDAAMDVPYRYWDWPFLDATAETRLRQVGTGEPTRNSRYRIAGAGDLLKMNARFSISGNEQQPVDDWFGTMGRRDPGGGLLGPLGAREYAFGDLGMPRDPLIASNARGRGATISSVPLDHPTEFDRFSLEGELPIGWDVELYSNERLLDFQSANGEARYTFPDVPLEFGVNRFRLVFHGPQGQVREEVVQRVIGAGMIRPGDRHYRLTVLRERDERRLAGQSPTNDRFLASYEFGVNRFLSLGGTARSLALDGERRGYGTIHANAAIPRLFSRLEYAAAPEGGHAISALLSTRAAGIDITGETAHFFDFDSERTRNNQVPGELLSRSELRLNTRLPRWGSLWTSLGATLDYDRGTLGTRTAGQARISVGGRYGTLTHLFETDRRVSDSSDSRRSRQRLLVSRRYGAVSLRGEMVHELVPEEAVSHVGASAEWSLGARATLRFSVHHAPQREVNTYGTGLSWRLSRVAIGASLQATDDHEYTAGLSISTSVVRDPGRGRWGAHALPQTQSGAVAVEVFLDENGNGVRDPGEPMIPNAQVRVGRTGLQVTTDSRGRAFLGSLPAHREVQVTLDTQSLENPFWVAGDQAHRMVLRPGRTAEIAIPVLPTGGIEGTIYRDEGSRLRSLSNQPVLIFTVDGELLQRTRSGYDGYYYVDGLTPGHYRIRPGAEEDGRRPRPNDIIVKVQAAITLAHPVDVILGSRVRQAGPSTPPRRVPEPFRTESWILAQSPSAYTIQLMAAGSEAAVQDYIEQHGLLEQAAYFRSIRDGKPWYSVVYGRFASYRETVAVQQSLPAALREGGPWPRRFGELHEIMDQEGPRR